MRIFAFVIILACTACTITPRKAVGRAPSYDGLHYDSGIITNLPDGSWIISEMARQRYEMLVALYGNQFLPPVRSGDGITPAEKIDERVAWRIDAEHLRKFMTMNRWLRERRAIYQEPKQPP